MLKRFYALFLGAFIFAPVAGAGPSLPTVVGLKGEAQVLLTTAAAGLPSMLYEGEKFFLY